MFTMTPTTDTPTEERLRLLGRLSAMHDVTAE